MRKQPSLIAILTVLLVGMLAASNPVLPEAKATWVWDDIHQDTVWTLTDSPFIIIKNITIESTYTLTIEPGVEVRFGDDFSLVINGRLIATGTPEHTIKFVSNKDQPLLGDWGTIRFANRSQTSTLACCIIEHAEHGITIENGNAQIRNCEISNNYHSGIYITGDNAGSIEDNTIQLNGDGILLSGDTSGTTIRNNRISANIENGISFQGPNGTLVDDILVFNNTISSNSKGIGIYGNVDTNITRNSISFNDVGVTFENVTTLLSPQFNDIYDNTNATRQTQSLQVNATYNYWGDPTGAYHVSLNPQGKGNPVQSDGYDLLFIPYLRVPNNYVNAQPVARLLSDKILVQPNQPITFIATNSSDDRRVDGYFFHFGDGRNTGWTTLSIFQHEYALAGTYQANVSVMDDFGAISNNIAALTINVQALTPLDVSMSLSQSRTVSKGTVQMTVRVMVGSSPVPGANVMILPILGGKPTPQLGSTDSEGYFTAAYMAPSISEQTNLRIIARAYRTGNADGSAYQYLEVVPPLSAEMTLGSSLLKSEDSVEVAVHVTYNSNPVQDATVALSSNNGSLAPQSTTTDADGWFRFTYQAPQTFTQLNVTITAAVTKIGYWAGSDQVELCILPRTSTVEADDIQQDTVWTLIDSPFIIIKNITVKSGYTLTIEPGVEVRFGGHFSLVVEGALHAVGTPEYTIKFDSNKDQPLPGDWGTIKLVNRLQVSTLAYSIIKHAEHGISIDNGNTQIRNCETSYNEHSGIYVTGDNAGSIEENVIQLNGDGVLLSGDTSGTTIRNNRISANIENGIDFRSGNGTHIDNTLVFNNTISSNSRGINIFGNVSTSITYNSVSFNDVGVYFENVTEGLSPQFNDIYSNIRGMNSTQSQPANAEYNYWGDQTGAYHLSLNPQGKGNPVQSNGYDIDFIPYLSAPNNYINAQPVARLLSDKILVQPNQPITFIATNSSDDRRVDKYSFDFGDNQNTGWTTLSVFEHKYALVGTYQANVKVMDDFGAISNSVSIVTINVQALTPLDVSMSLSQSQMVSEGTVQMTVRVMVGSSPVPGANVMILPILGGTPIPESGSTNSTGHFTAAFVAPNVSEETNIRIIARAYRTGDADGSAHQYLEVVPPLSAEMTLSSSLIKSEDSVDGTVHATYNSNPVESVTVSLNSDNGGSLTPQSASTDADGWFRFTYQAPQTFTQLNVTLTVTITKIGYWSGSDQVKLSIVPKTLTVEVVADPNTVDSEGSAGVTVHVSSDETTIANATVTVTSDLTSGLSNSTGLTDVNGDFRMVFTAPQTADLIGITISASANKSGYVDGQGQTSLTVNPAPRQGSGAVFGLSLTTLLIIIPVIVVVVVVILIKKRIIVFSRGEEAE